MTNSDRSPGPDLGGDSACWLNRVCPECGRFATDEALEKDDSRCAECGAELSV